MSTVPIEIQPPEPRVWSEVWAVVKTDKLALAGLVLIVLMLVVTVFAPWLAPFPEQGYGAPEPDTLTLAPSATHWFGTDALGRDILSRIIIGSRPSLLVPFVVVILAILIGAPLGAIAGFKGGWTDRIIMRLTDLFLAFPSLLLAIAITAALGRGLLNAAIALVISWWPWYTRLVRGVAAGLRETDFVEAARSIGLSRWQIVRKHILPNSMTPIIVQGTIDLGIVVIAMGGLAFIGLGTQPPLPDWGLMISEGRSLILTHWWVPTLPGLVMLVAVFSFNVMGDALRDLFDPRLRKR